MKANINIFLHFIFLIGILFLIISDVSNFFQISTQAPSKNCAYNSYVYSTYLCYSPFIKGESPLTGQQPSLNIVTNDLTNIFTSDIRFQGLRIYSPNYPDYLFTQLELKNAQLILSIDLTANASQNDVLFNQTKNILELYPNVKMLLIGNEFLQDAGNLTILKTNLKRYNALRSNITKELNSPYAPSPFLISEGDTYDSWMAYYPQLASLVDCIALQVYSYSGAVDQDVSNIFTSIQQMSATYPNASIFITEVGFPSVFNGQVQEQKQEQFYQLFFSRLGDFEKELAKPLLGVCLFEYSDEWWKDPSQDIWNNNGYPEENFGLVTEDRQSKLSFYYLEGLELPENNPQIAFFMVLGLFALLFIYFMIPIVRKVISLVKGTKWAQNKKPTCRAGKRSRKS